MRLESSATTRVVDVAFHPQLEFLDELSRGLLWIVVVVAFKMMATISAGRITDPFREPSATRTRSALSIALRAPRYDEQQHAFRPVTRASDTSQLGSRNETRLTEGSPDLVSGGRVSHRLAESTSSRSFLALGIDADRLDRAVDVLTANLGAVRVDVTQVLIEAMPTASHGGRAAVGNGACRRCRASR